MKLPKVNARLTSQSEREFAHSLPVWQQCFSRMETCDTLLCVKGYSSTRPVTFSQYRYPSPDRPAYSPSRPITVFRLYGPKPACDIGYHDEIAIHPQAGRTHSGATHETTIGLRLCKRHQSSLRQWQYLVWRVALKVMWNAALSAQVQALLPQKYWAQTAQGQCLQVLPQAYFATTQASTAAVKLDNRAHCGRINNRNRRRGNTLATVSLFFGDGK